jgi:hypothetical protein
MMTTNLTEITYSCSLKTKTSSGFAKSGSAWRHLKYDLGGFKQMRRAVGACMHRQVHLGPVCCSPRRMASLYSLL